MVYTLIHGNWEQETLADDTQDEPPEISLSDIPIHMSSPSPGLASDSIMWDDRPRGRWDRRLKLIQGDRRGEIYCNHRHGRIIVRGSCYDLTEDHAEGNNLLFWRRNIFTGARANRNSREFQVDLMHDLKRYFSDPASQQWQKEALCGDDISDVVGYELVQNGYMLLPDCAHVAQIAWGYDAVAEVHCWEEARNKRFVLDGFAFKSNKMMYRENTIDDLFQWKSERVEAETGLTAKALMAQRMGALKEKVTPHVETDIRRGSLVPYH